MIAMLYTMDDIQRHHHFQHPIVLMLEQHIIQLRLIPFLQKLCLMIGKKLSSILFGTQYPHYGHTYEEHTSRPYHLLERQ